MVALIMAAGVGSRFGSDKRRARLPDGRTLLEATVDNAGQVFDRRALVVRPGDDIGALLRSAEGAKIDVIVAPNAERGLAASLGDAFRHLNGTDRTSDACPPVAAAVMLGDMPWLRMATCRALIAHAATERIVIPRYRGRSGHPVLFGRDFWAELATLHAGEGAREIVCVNRQAVLTVEVDDDGIWRDVDHPTDLTSR
ncbi:hypothetical protein GCM10009038_20370 [Salinicola rhizosphaerae]|uniref:MobA-like NTP transferase domain-containing protein n=1 Tax=Salinicola rhizosphaerae TaxID=1443141 RepID=A0ABQ3E2M2_9GAMM|nr:hypothetical protein GCM10009038_20370 [Salinicola rhizosphaerae]